MQSITVFLQVDGVRGERTDDAGNPQRGKVPEITRGLESELVLKLRDPAGNPWEDLEEYAAWEFYAGDDWDPATPVLLAVTENLTAAGDEVRIPIAHTNNTALAAALGSSEKRSFHAELLGFVSGQEAPALVVQFEIVVRNRVAASGTELPEELPLPYLTAGSVRALVAEQTSSAAPCITAGGTWQVNGSDTGISATGPRGLKGDTGDTGPHPRRCSTTLSSRRAKSSPTRRRPLSPRRLAPRGSSARRRLFPQRRASQSRFPQRSARALPLRRRRFAQTSSTASTFHT